MKNILNIMFCIIVGVIVIDGLLNRNSIIIAENNRSNKNIIITPAKTLPKIEKSILSFFPAKINSHNRSYAQKIDMDKIGFIESSNNPNAISNKGARGQYQIMRGTWDECIEKMGYDKRDWDYNKNWNNSDKNRRVGQYYMNVEIPRLLHWNHDRIPDTIESRLACYNAGINTVSQAYSNSIRIHNGKTWIDYLPQETQDYIKKYKNTPLHEIR